ncbi:unnamed protein product [Peniophora sp. CBMAI 1063]|nr:unnamed protein product [Peniophora sp. CBMAI 1063]
MGLLDHRSHSGLVRGASSERPCQAHRSSVKVNLSSLERETLVLNDSHSRRFLLKAKQGLAQRGHVGQKGLRGFNGVEQAQYFTLEA